MNDKKINLNTEKCNGVIKREAREQKEDYQRRHEKSLLKILIEKLPEDAKQILNEVETRVA